MSKCLGYSIAQGVHLLLKRKQASAWAVNKVYFHCSEFAFCPKAHNSVGSDSLGLWMYSTWNTLWPKMFLTQYIPCFKRMLLPTQRPSPPTKVEGTCVSSAEATFAEHRLHASPMCRLHFPPLKWRWFRCKKKTVQRSLWYSPCKQHRMQRCPVTHRKTPAGQLVKC